ncbi:tetratricopeptide repeat protein [bacterium]|nr:tetratricopeptide repeat protein [bacterium]
MRIFPIYLLLMLLLAVASGQQVHAQHHHSGMGGFQGGGGFQHSGGSYHHGSSFPLGGGGYADLTSPSWGGSHHSYSGGSYRNHGFNGAYGIGGSGFGGGYGNYGGYGSSYYGGRGYRYPYYGGFYSGGGLLIGFGLPPAYGYGLNFGYNYPYNGYGLSTLYPYGTYYQPSSRYLEYYLPPTQPAELNYGPQAVKQFMGLPRDFATQPQLSGTFGSSGVTPLPSPLRINAAKPAAVEQPKPQAIARADQFIQTGDNLFGQQRYHEALSRYRDAVAAAPGYAPAHLRKALAYLATNQPDEAAESIQRAIIQDPNIVANSNVTLEGLLGQSNGLARSSIIEANARRAVSDPQNPTYLYCVAVLLYFDQQPQRSEQFFSAALRAGGDVQYIEPFTTQIQKTTTTTTPAIDL